MKRIRPARAIGLAVRYSERLVAKQLGNKTFGTARHITTTLKHYVDDCISKMYEKHVFGNQKNPTK